MPLSHTELEAIIPPLLAKCDATGREWIAELALKGWLDTVVPESRLRALDEFRARVRWWIEHGG